MATFSATVSAPVNIATLKYWGKRDAVLNLPTNSSISVTLSQEDLRATTTARCSEKYTEDTLWLNGHKEDLSKAARTLTVIKNLRALRAGRESSDAGLPKISDLNLQIVSENNFPTAAGLASSAAGFAALVSAIARLYELSETPTELSRYSRQGSGSACRSLFGGYVAWEMGSKADGSDSQAVEVAPIEHWPTMRAAILVVSAAKKDVASTAGMQVTVKTSSLFAERINKVVPQRFEEMKKTILERDFPRFAELTMADSNQFHAVCLDSMPPIFYLNDVSRAAIRTVELINEKAGKIIAAYTFDAGPNCVIYYEAENEAAVLAGLAMLKNVSGFPNNAETADLEAPTHRFAEPLAAGIERIIMTRVGPGPQVLNESLPEAPLS